MRVVLCICLLCHAHSYVAAQTEPEVRSKAIAAASKILDMGSVSFEVEVHGDDKIEIVEGVVNVQQLGKQKRLSYEQKTITSPNAPKDLQERLLAASGSRLPAIFAFDGKTSFEYRPLRLSLIKQPEIELSIPRTLSSLFPDNWVSISGLPAVNVNLFLAEVHGAAAVVPKDTQNHWVFQKTYPKNFAFGEVQMVVDPRKECHIIRIETTGGLGNSSAEFDWEQDSKSGKWFPRKAKIHDYRGFEVQWAIKTIDFSASAISEPFTLTDDTVPFGTRVTTVTKDANGVEKQVNHFVGGEDGKLEYKLRHRALGDLREGSK